jgi:cytochrome c peroxidase
MKKIPKLILGVGLLIANTSFAHGPRPTPLIDVPTPEVPGLLDGSSPIVVDKNMAIALGKALFWDTNVGSDGMACGSCHFHAGADARVKNQINPGGDKSNNPAPQTFDILESGAGGPNHKLSLADFPLHAFNDPISQDSGVQHTTDDVVASAGTFSGTFKFVSQLSGSADVCDRSADPVYHVGNIGTRRVEPRNAPTVINAVFNYRNFWDGRANNTFNGSSPWGGRDPNAGVWVQTSPRLVEKQRLHLINSSLASLSVAPPLSDAEMSCRGRNLASIGRKLLNRQPLQYQNVHAEDSVFGPLNLTYSTTGLLKPSLRTTYKTMITKAFNPKYWAYGALGPFGTPGAGQLPYNQVEANFSMFFGIALQLYQSTLVSDQAPIDQTPRDTNLYPTWAGMGKTATEIAQLKRGMTVFENNHCLICHAGPTMTAASVQTNATLVTPLPGKFYGPSNSRIAYGPQSMGGPFPISQALAAGISQYKNLVNRDSTNGGVMLLDLGFANTGVGDPSADKGLAGTDDFGNPFSFVDQYVQYLLGNSSNIIDPGIITTRVCEFTEPLSFNVNLGAPLDGLFTIYEGIELDGNREQSLRNQGCQDPDTAYIPTVKAANTSLTANPGLLATAKQAAFKIPGLRNVELTGPYMHNGSMATLDQVLEFYARHGNFENPNKNGNVTNNAVSNLDDRLALLAFLKTFTDDRVRYEKAPFDHPEISVPHGHVGNDLITTPSNPLNPKLAKDEFLVVPAVGANGNTQPLLPFDQLLAH